MNGWITSLACVGVLLFLVVGGFILVGDQIKGMRQLGQFARYLLGTFKAEKGEWERKKASQEDSALEGAGARGSLRRAPMRARVAGRRRGHGSGNIANFVYFSYSTLRE